MTPVFDQPLRPYTESLTCKELTNIFIGAYLINRKLFSQLIPIRETIVRHIICAHLVSVIAAFISMQVLQNYVLSSVMRTLNTTMSNCR